MKLTDQNKEFGESLISGPAAHSRDEHEEEAHSNQNKPRPVQAWFFKERLHVHVVEWEETAVIRPEDVDALSKAMGVDSRED